MYLIIAAGAFALFSRWFELVVASCSRLMFSRTGMVVQYDRFSHLWPGFEIEEVADEFGEVRFFRRLWGMSTVVCLFTSNISVL